MAVIKYEVEQAVQLRKYMAEKHPHIGHQPGTIRMIEGANIYVLFGEDTLVFAPSHIRPAGRAITEAPKKGEPKSQPARLEKLSEPTDVRIFSGIDGKWYVQAHRLECTASKRLEKRYPLRSWVAEGVTTVQEITEDYASDFLPENPDMTWEDYSHEILFHECLGL